MKCEYVFTKSKWGKTDRRTFQEEYVLLIFQNLKALCYRCLQSYGEAYYEIKHINTKFCKALINFNYFGLYHDSDRKPFIGFWTSGFE